MMDFSGALSLNESFPIFSFLTRIISCFDVVSQTLMNQILQATATLRESFGKVMKRVQARLLAGDRRRKDH